MRPAAGIGFKPEYFEDVASSAAAGLWFEVHAENYMVAGGPRLAMLEWLRGGFSLSLHGVGLSLAGFERPDLSHLDRLKLLIDRFEPDLVSEHLAWSRIGDSHFPDLLPFPRSREALGIIARNIDVAQEAIGRELLIENPSHYMELPHRDYTEVEFLRELVGRTGCRLLIDVNNLYVSENNIGVDPVSYVAALPSAAIGELHLAGHSVDPNLGNGLLIDSHDAPVDEAVWQLYETIIEKIGPRPTLIERDGNIPAFSEVEAEACRAQKLLHREMEASLV